MAPPLIYLNAYPGTGKLTIARALIDLLSTRAATTVNSASYQPTFFLLDVHQLVDPVAKILGRDDPRYLGARAAVRDAVLESLVDGIERAVPDVVGREGFPVIEGAIFDVGETVVKAARAGREGALVVCTDAQVNNPTGPAFASAYRHAAHAANRHFVSVILTCAPAENATRLLSAERVASSTTKLRNAKVLCEFRNQWDVFRFGFARNNFRTIEDAARTSGLNNKIRVEMNHGVDAEVEIDVTHLSPEEAAGVIADELGLVGGHFFATP